MQISYRTEAYRISITSSRNSADRNVAVALDRLQALHIPVVAQRTGGNSGLALNLLTSTGEVLVRRVPWREA